MPGGSIGVGLCVLLGIAEGDSEGDAVRLAEKVARLRIFEDENGKFDRSLLDVGGAALVVSQFTLIADTRKGNRPSFAAAAAPEHAEAYGSELAAQLVRVAHDEAPALAAYARRQLEWYGVHRRTALRLEGALASARR
jgi:D-tyrosyl-tRNA(Tyr) deacylase